MAARFKSHKERKGTVDITLPSYGFGIKCKDWKFEFIFLSFFFNFFLISKGNEGRSTLLPSHGRGMKCDAWMFEFIFFEIFQIFLISIF